MPAPTPGSPRSSRISVGTDMPSRLAHARWDSRRRTRAMARFSPRARRAWAAAGGMTWRACGLFGITKSLSIRSIWSSLYYQNPTTLSAAQALVAKALAAGATPLLIQGYAAEDQHPSNRHGHRERF